MIRQLRALLAVAASVLFLFPLYRMMVNAHKSNEAILNTRARPPLSPTLDGFSAVIDSGDVSGGLRNSVIITGGTIILIMVVASMLAFALHVSDSRTGNALNAVILFGLILPTPVILIPVFRVLKVLHLQNSFVGRRRRY